MPGYKKIKKQLNYLFLNTVPNAAAGTEKWSRAGKAAEWTDMMNVKTVSHDYIEDESPTDVIEYYQPSVSVPLTAYKGDPVYEYVFGLYQKQDVSPNTATKVLRVFQSTNPQGKNIAQVTDCAVIIDNFNFATGVITFMIKQCDAPVFGVAEVAAAMDTIPYELLSRVQPRVLRVLTQH